MKDRPRPRRGTAIDWRHRRKEIAAKVLPLFLNRPWRNVTVEDVAAETGLSFWQIYYSFDGQEDVYRAAVTQLIETIAQRIDSGPDVAPTILETIKRFVNFISETLQTQSYRQLLYLRIRDEPVEPWLGIQYRKRIGNPMVALLKAAISASGEEQGLQIAIDDRRCRETLISLEASLAFPSLLQNQSIDAEFSEQAIRSSAKKIWAATYSLENEMRLSA
ncbi:MAG: hypothetical protein AAGE05_08880 [Pseudomonadota bacterium]